MYKLNSGCEKKCCPPKPHYNLTVSDDDFIHRNVELSELCNKRPDSLDQLPQYRYGGNLAEDELRALPAYQYDAYVQESNVARRSKRSYWYNDGTTGRHYARGLDDGMDHTINERNNFASGWFNAMEGHIPYSGDPLDKYFVSNKDNNYSTKTLDCDGMPISYTCKSSPGAAPYRHPYVENDIPVNPDNYIRPLTNMSTYQNKHYFYSIYDLVKYPQTMCYPKVETSPRTAACYQDYPEKYL